MAATHEDRNAQLSPGVAIKAPCRLATTANITLNGEQTIDGIAAVSGDRVFVKNQTDTTASGLYTVSTGSWTREPDFDGTRDVVEGTIISVNQGATNSDTMWRVTNTGTIVFGTTALTFERALVNDSATVTFLQSGTGAVARSVQSKERDVVSALDYYANGVAGPAVDPTGVIDSTTGLQNFFNNSSKRGLQPAGIYKTTGMLTIPINSHFCGDGSGSGISVIKPSGAVSVAIEYLGSSSCLEHLYVDGVNTTNAIGIRVGNDTLTDEAVMRDVQVWNFTGATGVGMRIVNMVRAGFYDLYVSGNGTNLDIGSTSSSTFPDSLHFYNSVFHSSTAGPGVNISAGFEISFIDCTSEANFQAGYSVIPPAGGQVFNVRWIGGWLEANWLGTASGAARFAKYHIDVDGTTGGTAVVNNILIDGPYFNGSATECSAIHLNKVFNIRLLEPITQQLAGAIVVDNTSSSGWLDKYQAWPTSFTDNSGRIIISDKLYEAWTAYTPIYSTNVGNAAASFTGTPTTNTARYRVVGKTFQIAISFNGTLLAITPNTISATFPAGSSPHDSLSFSSAVVANAGTFEVGKVRAVTSADVFSFTRINGTNWGSGATFECDVVYSCELA